MPPVHLPAHEPNLVDFEYSEALRHVLEHGNLKSDRTGVGTCSITGLQMHFNCDPSAFPILTAKKVNFAALWAELLWIMNGETNAQVLRDIGTKIWDEWADKEHTSKWGREVDDLGPTYGWQWRRFGQQYDEQCIDNSHVSFAGTDQLASLISNLRDNPFSRRLILSAWHPYQANRVDLPPCLTQIQLVAQGRKNEAGKELIDLVLTQRSGDMFLGVPFDLSAHALLLNILCTLTGHAAGMLIHNIADAHLYLNHFNQVNEYLARIDDGRTHKAPELVIDFGADTPIEAICTSQVRLLNYSHEKTIKAPIAV